MSEPIPDQCCVVGCWSQCSWELVAEDLPNNAETFYYCDEHKRQKQDEYGYDDGDFEIL